MGSNCHFKGIKKILVLSLLVVLSFLLPGSQSSNDRQSVILTVNQFFKVLQTNDLNLARNILLKESCFFSVRNTAGNKEVKITTFKHLMDSLKKAGQDLREEMFYPKVRIHKDIASVWAEYKFYRDQKLSHCGVDSFNLIRIDGQWMIASIVYTVEMGGCLD